MCLTPPPPSPCAQPGSGTKPSLLSHQTVVSNFFPSQPAPNFLVGPTGLLVANENLIIADTVNNAIWVAYGAGASTNAPITPQKKCDGATNCPGLNQPLGLCVVPSGPNTGNLIVQNAGDANIVELNAGYNSQVRTVVGGVGLAAMSLQLLHVFHGLPYPAWLATIQACRLGLPHSTRLAFTHRPDARVPACFVQVNVIASGNPGAGTLFGCAVLPDASNVLFVDDSVATLNKLVPNS
jgi:hypothetical protein